MTRVAVSKVHGVAYVRVVQDYRKGDGWGHLTLISTGRFGPESHAKAILADLLLERLAVLIEKDANSALRNAFEAEVVRTIGADPVAQLRQALRGGTA